MRVPTYRRQTQRTSEVGGRQFSVRADPGAMSAGARGAASFFQDVADVASGMAIDMAKTKRDQEIVAAETELMLESDRIKNEVIGSDLDPDQYEPEYNKRMAEARQKIIRGGYNRNDGSAYTGVNNSAALEIFNTRVYPKYSFSGSVDIRKQARIKLADITMADLVRLEETAAQQVGFASSNIEAQTITDSFSERIDEAVANNYISREDGERRKVAFRDRAGKLRAADLLATAKDSPELLRETIRQVRSGEIDLPPSVVDELGIEASKMYSDAIKKKDEETKSELETYIVNIANSQDNVSKLAYLIETGNPTGDPVMDKIAEQFTPEERREIGKKIRQARKDHIDSINREEAFAENQRKKAIETYDVLFDNLEASNAPTEKYLELIKEAQGIDRVYALKKQTQYITPQGGFKKRVVQQTTPRGQEFMQSRRDRGAFSFNDLQNPIFLNEVTPDDRNKFRNEVLAAENTEVKRAMVRAQATLQLPAGFENSVMSENNPNFERAQILTRVQNRLNMGLIEAQKKQQDFDAFAVVDKIIEEETAAVDNIVGKAQREQAERAITFANELAKSYEGVPEFTNALDAYNFLVGIQDQTDPPSRVKQAKPRIPGQIEALRRRMLRE